MSQNTFERIMSVECLSLPLSTMCSAQAWGDGCAQENVLRIMST